MIWCIKAYNFVKYIRMWTNFFLFHLSISWVMTSQLMFHFMKFNSMLTPVYCVSCFLLPLVGVFKSLFMTEVKWFVYMWYTSMVSPSHLQADAAFIIENVVKTGLAWCPEARPTAQLHRYTLNRHSQYLHKGLSRIKVKWSLNIRTEYCVVSVVTVAGESKLSYVATLTFT